MLIGSPNALVQPEAVPLVAGNRPCISRSVSRPSLSASSMEHWRNNTECLQHCCTAKGKLVVVVHVDEPARKNTRRPAARAPKRCHGMRDLQGGSATTTVELQSVVGKRE